MILARLADRSEPYCQGMYKVQLQNTNNSKSLVTGSKVNTDLQQEHVKVLSGKR